MLEQTPAFFTSLWLHAIFSDVYRATWLGAAYICFRCLYPVVFGQGHWMSISTTPMHTIIAALLLPVMWQAMQDVGAV